MKRYTHLLARLRGITNCRSVAVVPLSRARYRNNSVCQVARKYTQRLYDRDEIRFEAVPTPLPTTSIPGGIASKQYLATFREPGSPSDCSFASIQSRFLRAALQVNRDFFKEVSFPSAVYFSVLRFKIATSN